MNCFELIFADLDPGTIVKLVAVFIFLILPVIGQLLAKIKQIPPPEKRPNPPQVQPDVADEIEQFMRRKAEEASRKPMRRQRPVTIEELPSTRPASKPNAKPVSAEVVVERPVGGQVNKHVASFLDERGFSQREQQLGQNIAQAKEEIQQHLQSVFDHRVSKLEAVQGEAAQPTAATGEPGMTDDSSGAELYDMLTNPQTLRQAIILNEILRRPVL